MARQIMAINETHHLIWEEIADDKWQETLISRFERESGGYEWCTVSTTDELEEADVEAFASQLEATGFTLYKRWN